MGGNEVGAGGKGAGSVLSPVFRRDRGRWCSPEDRMKLNLDNRPPVPEELRFRPGVAVERLLGLLVLEASATAGVGGDCWSITKLSCLNVQCPLR